jgi:hypothetical protein
MTSVHSQILFRRKRELISFLTKRLTLFLKTHAALPVWAEWPLLFVRERLYSGGKPLFCHLFQCSDFIPDRHLGLC